MYLPTHEGHEKTAQKKHKNAKGRLCNAQVLQIPACHRQSTFDWQFVLNKTDSVTMRYSQSGSSIVKAAA